MPRDKQKCRKLATSILQKRYGIEERKGGGVLL